MAHINLTSEVTLENTKVPMCFYGNVFQDMDDWLGKFELLEKFNQ